MLSPLRLLNFALGLVAVMIAAALAKAWVAPAPSVSSSPASKSSHEAAAVSFHRPARPPIGQFDVLFERNPFRQPAPPRAMPPGMVPPAPPPPPLPTLVGTIFVDDERRAILTEKGKGNIYSVGQDVAGGKLTAIKEDRVLFKRGEVESEITLKAPIKPGATAPRSAPAPAGLPPRPQAVPPPPPPLAIEGAPAQPGRPLSRVERRRLRLLRQEGAGQPSMETAE
jgi:hypothetical protein